MRGGGLFTTMKISSGARMGSRLSSIVSTSEKMAVFAPIPSASDSTAMAEAPGVLRIIRSE